MNRSAKQLNLVHGWGLGREIWMPLLGYLDGWGEIRCIDLPGYGDGPTLQPDLHAWSDALARDAAPGSVWIGSSLGGLIAADIADRHPDKVSGLITIGSTPCFVQKPGWPHAMSAADFEQFQREVAEDPAAALTRFMVLATEGGLTARDDLRQLRAIGSKSGTISAAALLAGLEILGSTDARSIWRKLECACLHMVPENDALVPASVLQFHQDSPALQQTSLLGSASHLPWLGRPRPIAELVNAWEGPFAP